MFPGSGMSKDVHGHVCERDGKGILADLETCFYTEVLNALLTVFLNFTATVLYFFFLLSQIVLGDSYSNSVCLPVVSLCICRIEVFQTCTAIFPFRFRHHKKKRMADYLELL